MIQDSIPWKEDLLRIADRLDKKRTQKRWTERSGYLVERDVMTSAYTIRRLVESWKVSDRLASRSFQINRFALLGSPPDFMNKFFFWELYDLDSPVRVDLSLREVCNQIMHSWMWAISATESNEFDGIYVASDKDRNSKLYWIPIDQLISIIRDIGREDVTAKEIVRDVNGQFKSIRIDGVLHSS